MILYSTTSSCGKLSVSGTSSFRRPLSDRWGLDIKNQPSIAGVWTRIWWIIHSPYMLAVRTWNVQWFWSIQKYCKSWSWSSGLHLQNVAARANVGWRNISMLSINFYEWFLMSIFGVRWLLNCFDLSDELPSSAPSCQHPVEIAIFNGFEPYPCKKSSRISLYLLNNMCMYIYMYNISYYCRYTYIIIMYHEHSEYSTHTCGI